MSKNEPSKVKRNGIVGNPAEPIAAPGGRVAAATLVAAGTTAAAGAVAVVDVVSVVEVGAAAAGAAAADAGAGAAPVLAPRLIVRKSILLASAALDSWYT